MLSAIFNLRFALITWPAILLVLAAGLMVGFPAQDWWLVPFAALCLCSVLVGLQRRLLLHGPDRLLPPHRGLGQATDHPIQPPRAIPGWCG